MQDVYYHAIDKNLKELITKTKDFYTILQEIKGVHPIEIRRSLDRLYKDCSINKSEYDDIILSSKTKVSRDEDINEYLLPLPHQIDYDWRFSSNGIAVFFNRINKIIESENIKKVVFIGSPSLFRFYTKHNNQGIKFYLIDFNANKHLRSESLEQNFNIINCNVNYDMPDNVDYKMIKANLVIMDPPWYVEYYKKFFDICSDICDSICLVCGVFPPVLTRDTILAERNEISNYISEYGFDKLSFEQHIIEYSTPPFEINVLRINNILNYPLNWRVGDFFYTRRINLMQNLIEKSFVSVRDTSWFEVSVGKIRIKCKQESIKLDDLFNISLRSIYPDNIYPSVSRRYIGSQDINVWTSGNRVFCCTNIPLLTEIIQEINNPNIVLFLEREYNISLTEIQKKAIIEVQGMIKNVIEIEEGETRKWNTYEI